MKQVGCDFTLANGHRVPISKGISANGLVFISGQLALRDGTLVDGDIARQTHLALDNIEAILALEGLKLENVCKATVWLTNASDFPLFNGVWAERMREPYPARSTILSGLLIPGALVEIEVCAQTHEQPGRSSDTV